MSDGRPPEPYKGLMAFEEDDVQFFFGREREQRIISANLRTRRLTLLYGPSGVGKSSLINAGVVYHIRKQAAARSRDRLAALRAAAEQSDAELASNPMSVMVLKFSSWVGDSLEVLKEKILDDLIIAYPALRESRNEIRSASLTEMLSQATKTANVQLLIILDQFEEFFVYHPSEESSRDFVEEFSRAVAELDVPVNFLISIRQDWLARLDIFKGRIPGLFENSIRIDHLDRQAARAAIEKPIERYNELVRDYRAADGSDLSEVRLSRDFTFKLLDQLEQLDKPDETDLPRSSDLKTEFLIHAPRLQIVMKYLWERVKHKTPPTFGPDLPTKRYTAKQIIESNTYEIFEHLSRREKLVAARCLRFLITESGTKFASTAKGLVVRSGGEPKEIEPLLEKLSSSQVRILNRVMPPPDQPREIRYELASDVLANPILDWSQYIRKKHETWFIVTGVAAIVFVAVVLVAIGVSLRRSIHQRNVLNRALNELTEQQVKTKRALKAVRDQDERIPFSKAVLRAHSEKITSAQFTRNGDVLTASLDGSAILWDIRPREPIPTEFRKDADEKLVMAAASPQDNIVVTASTHGTVMLWDVATLKNEELRGRIGKHVTDLSFTPGGDLIAASTVTGEVIVWKTSTRARVAEIPGNGKAINQLSFNRTGEYLAAASVDHTVHLWRVGKWTEPRLLTGHTDKVNGLAFSPKGDFLASASADTTVRLWDVATGQSREFKGAKASINSVSFDREGSHLLTANDDLTACVWTIATKKCVELIGHTDKVLSASFSPNGELVVTGSKDTSVRIWSARTGKSLAELRGHLDEVTYVIFSDDGKLVLTASKDATARVWIPQIGNSFEIQQPTISASINNLPTSRHSGPCPVTVSFLAGITSVRGAGTVSYRLRGSDGRVWPIRNLFFDEPQTKYVNFYWGITQDYTGSETIEIIEPRGFKKQKATFTINCTTNQDRSPVPAPTAAPSASP